MNRPIFPSEPPREPSREITTTDQEYVGGYNAGDFIAALRRIKRRHPDATDEAFEIHYHDDEGLIITIYSTSINHNYERDMVIFQEKLEASRKEYAAYLEAYKASP